MSWIPRSAKLKCAASLKFGKSAKKICSKIFLVYSNYSKHIIHHHGMLDEFYALKFQMVVDFIIWIHIHVGPHIYCGQWLCF